MALSSFFRPKTFLHFISLLTATEFITIALLINKVEGVYGILALFTGYHLSALQLSMYIYSILVLGLVCYLGPHIRRQSPLQNLALAWIYLLDTLINAAYTTLFGLSWFILLAQHLSPTDDDDTLTPPGGQTINDTAGFTDPEHTVDRVEIIASPKPGLAAGQDAVAHGVAGSAAGSGNVIFESGSMMSITTIGALWFVRLYFVIVVMAYARSCLRARLASSAAEPFPGQTWQDRLGRAMTAFPRAYWFGGADEDWARDAGERFGVGRGPESRRGPLLKNPPPPPKGTGERERRARSGTGPPPIKLGKLGKLGKEGVGSGSDA